MPKYKDITGFKYNRLTALEFSHTERGTTFWKFKCDCGNIVERRVGNVLSGNTKSCGCYKTEVMTEFDRTKHGLFNTPFWSAFHGARHRCNCETDKDYADYGGRGILFCWKSIEDFYNDMKDTYFDGATLERVDVDGNYSSSNCRWENSQEASKK